MLNRLFMSRPDFMHYCNDLTIGFWIHDSGFRAKSKNDETQVRVSPKTWFKIRPFSTGRCTVTNGRKVEPRQEADLE